MDPIVCVKPIVVVEMNAAVVNVSPRPEGCPQVSDLAVGVLFQYQRLKACVEVWIGYLGWIPGRRVAVGAADQQAALDVVDSNGQ